MLATNWSIFAFQWLFPICHPSGFFLTQCARFDQELLPFYSTVLEQSVPILHSSIFNRISIYFGVSKLFPSEHILISRNMTFISLICWVVSNEKSVWIFLTDCHDFCIEWCSTVSVLDEIDSFDHTIEFCSSFLVLILLIILII